MAVSDKQLAANRRNAKLSTGPKTKEGKERSSLNGFKHPNLGLTALMVDEDRLAQSEFVTEYLGDLNPEGAVERQMARTLAIDNWRINRIKAVEENIFAWGLAVENVDCCQSEILQVENALTHAVSYIQYADQINKLSLYESRLSRIIARNLDLFNKRQAERHNRAEQPEAAPIAEPQTQTAAATAQQNQTLNQQNGFDQRLSPQPEKQPAIEVDAVPIAA
jgi:hypothetical protein